MLDQRFFANIDWVLCFLVLLICGVGLIALSSATVGTPGQEDYLIQQVFRILVGIGVIILVQLVHYRNWARLGFVMHLVVIGLLVLVLFYGTGGPGAPARHPGRGVAACPRAERRSGVAPASRRAGLRG